MSRATSVALATAACIGIAAALDGSYTPVSWSLETVGLLFLALVALAVDPAPSVPRLGVPVLAGLTALAAWQVLSLAWTESVPLTVLEPQLTLVPLAASAAALLWLRPGDLPAVAWGALGASTFTCVWNLLARIGAGADTGETAAPIGYANSLGLLAVLGILVAAGIGIQSRGTARVAAIASAAPCVAVLWLSESRGAQVALLTGAVVGLAACVRHARAAVLLATAAGIVASLALAWTSSAERRAYWTVAFDGWAREPLLGSGAGTWVRSWLAHRSTQFSARDAHSLYLQALSELGVVGLVTLAVALLPPLLAVHRCRTPVARSVLAAYAAFVVHLAVDFDWRLAVLPVAGLALGAALLADGERVIVRRRPLLAIASVVAAGVVLLLAGNVLTSRAERALRAGDPGAALASARHAARLAPWASEPWRLRGEAEQSLGREREASASFQRGIERDVGDVELWRALVRVTSGAERRRAQVRATELDPLSARTTSG